MTVDTPSLARLSAQWRQRAQAIRQNMERQGTLVEVIALTQRAELLAGCADELDALQRQLCEEKTDEDSLTRMVEADPLTLETPRPPDR